MAAEARFAGDSRVAVVGRTGSGKTFALRLLSQRLTRLVVLDGKGTLRGKEWALEPWSAKLARDLKRGYPVRIRVPAPASGNWEPFLWACYEAGNCTVLIDELNLVAPSSSISNHPALWSCFARGREFRVGVWAGVQRPKVVPLNFLSECDWILAFRLQLETDRKRMAEVMGNAVNTPIRDKHGFFLYNAEWDSPRYYGSLK